MDGEEISSEVAEKLKNFFIQAVENLEIEHFKTHDLHTDSSNDIDEILKQSDDIDEILKQYEIHPSVLKIWMRS